MRVTNITDKSNCGVKPIGFGDITIMPGETKELADNVAYVYERDRDGNMTGKRSVLPVIKTLARLGMVSYVEDEPAKTGGADGSEDKGEMSDEEKKAAAAAKRAATRAANKAAKEAGKAE